MANDALKWEQEGRIAVLTIDREKTRNALDEDVVDALEAAIEAHGCPEIFNSDQGSQFTSKDFTDVLNNAGIQISMDGKGRWVDNVFVERLWRSLKYEEVYLKGYDNAAVARRSISNYFDLFNQERRHQSLNRQTPDQVYYELADPRMAA